MKNKTAFFALNFSFFIKILRGPFFDFKFQKFQISNSEIVILKSEIFEIFEI
jgi:hypothetical protein